MRAEMVLNKQAAVSRLRAERWLLSQQATALSADQARLVEQLSLAHRGPHFVVADLLVD